MYKRRVLATALATGGVLLAASIASVAVVNAASSSQTSSAGVALVSAAGGPATIAVLPTTEATPQESAPAVEASPQATPKKTAKPSPAPKASTKPSTKPSARPSSKPSAQPEPSERPEPVATVSEDSAARIAAASAGGNVIGVTKGSHGGRRSWAVRIERRDGSRVTGYVDRRSGEVFDWIVQHRPTSDGPNDDHSDDNHNSGERPDDNQGGNDNHGQGNNNGHGNDNNNGQNRPGQGSGHDHDDD